MRGPSPKYGAGSKRATNITKAVARLVARDMRPVTVMEGEGFIKLMQGACSGRYTFLSIDLGN